MPMLMWWPVIVMVGMYEAAMDDVNRLQRSFLKEQDD